ncbi:MAG: NifU family protein [bacterium]|nr:NifU family protein [bacterium]
MREQVEKALEEVRPMLALHAGNIELVAVEGGIVKVRLLGTCRGCPLSELTLKAGVEELLKERVPGVTGVEAVA